jgi:hypothetical protein
VSRVEGGPLAALVSEAPAGLVKANRRNLMAHSAVLQAVIEQTCVLPMRFGVVMPSADAVRDVLLAEHEDRLLVQLDAFEQLVELDLKLLCPEEVLLRRVLKEEPDLAELNERLRGQSEDATYYERIRLGELVAQAAEARRAALLQQVVVRLEPLAVETEVAEPTHDEMLVNVAFLVARDRVAEFDDAVTALDGELGTHVRTNYVGPLPPYRFVDTATGVESQAWA